MNSATSSQQDPIAHGGAKVVDDGYDEYEAYLYDEDLNSSDHSTQANSGGSALEGDVCTEIENSDERLDHGDSSIECGYDYGEAGASASGNAVCMLESLN